MGNLLEFGRLPQLAPLAQALDRASEIGSEELPEHEHSEELRLGKLLGTARVRVGCQGVLVGGVQYLTDAAMQTRSACRSMTSRLRRSGLSAKTSA